jgi:hypothetical protein
VISNKTTSSFAGGSEKARAAISHAFFERVSRALGKERCRTIDRLLEADGIDKRSLWQSLKADAGAPTLKQSKLSATAHDFLEQSCAVAESLQMTRQPRMIARLCAFVLGVGACAPGRGGNMRYRRRA